MCIRDSFNILLHSNDVCDLILSKMKIYNTIFEVSKYLLIILFIYSGCTKLIGHYIFLDQLTHIPVLKHYAGFSSMFIPIIEIAAGIMLVFQNTTIIGWWICSILLSSFTIYISAMLLFAPHLPCSCGGIISSLTWKQHLVLNFLLASVGWFNIYQHNLLLKFSMHTRE